VLPEEIAAVVEIRRARHGGYADSISSLFPEINRVNIMQRMRRFIHSFDF
jgi:hypothetical protein